MTNQQTKANNSDPFDNRFEDNSSDCDANVGYRRGWFGVELGYFDPQNYHSTQQVPISPVPDEVFARVGDVLTRGAPSAPLIVAMSDDLPSRRPVVPGVAHSAAPARLLQ